MSASESRYDYVVIGAGAAGSIVAGEAAAAGHTVLLLEAGLEVQADNNEVWDPSRWYEPLKDSTLEIGFESTGQVNLDNRILPMLQSKALGGCQIHNAMVYVRGGRSTYDHWANELCCTGWSYQELVPLFQRIESTVGISVAPASAFGDALIAAFGRAGLPLNPNYNDGPTEYGSVPFQYTVDGRSAPHHQLPEIYRRAGATDADRSARLFRTPADPGPGCSHC